MRPLATKREGKNDYNRIIIVTALKQLGAQSLRHFIPMVRQPQLQNIHGFRNIYCITRFPETRQVILKQG